MSSLNLVTVIAPLAIIALAIPLILEKVPRNRYYGFRTPFTMSSDPIWYRANKIAGITLVAAGIFWLALGQILPHVTHSGQSAERLVVWIGAGGIMAACAIAYLRTYRA
jgi:hypothetical protein